MEQRAGQWTRPRTSALVMRSPDDLGAAWDAVHRALPVGWVTSPPVYQQETRTWAAHALDARGSRPILGSREEAFGADLPAALRELASRLRARPPAATPAQARAAAHPAHAATSAVHAAAAAAGHGRSYGHLHVVR